MTLTKWDEFLSQLPNERRDGENGEEDVAAYINAWSVI